MTRASPSSFSLRMSCPNASVASSLVFSKDSTSGTHELFLFSLVWWGCPSSCRLTNVFFANQVESRHRQPGRYRSLRPAAIRHREQSRTLSSWPARFQVGKISFTRLATAAVRLIWRANRHHQYRAAPNRRNATLATSPSRPAMAISAMSGSRCLYFTLATCASSCPFSKKFAR